MTSRRRWTGVGAAIMLIVAGCGGGSGGEMASARIWFNCLDLERSPVDGTDESSQTTVEHTCSIDPDGTDLVRSERRVLVTFGPIPSPDGSLIAVAPFPADLGDSDRWLIVAPDGSTQAEVPVPDGVRSLMPSWTPEGDALVAGLDDGVAIVPIDGGEPAVVATGWSTVGTPMMSPDGSTIAVAVEADGASRLAIVDRRTGEVRIVEAAGSVASPAWSPDGSAVVTAGTDRAELVMVDTVTSDVERISVGGDGLVFSPSFSPDGRLVAVPSDHLVIVDVATGSVRDLAVDWATDWAVASNAPSWSADSNSVVVNALDPARNEGSLRSELLVVDVDTGDVTVLRVEADDADSQGGAFPVWVDVSA